MFCNLKLPLFVFSVAVRQVIFISAIISLLASCRKDPAGLAYNACNFAIDTASSSYFDKEAHDFAYQEISNDANHSGYNEVELDPATVYYYMGRLSAIYREAEQSKGSLHDMIFKYSINNLGNGAPGLNSYIVVFKDSSLLRNEVISNPGNTSNPFLNELYNEHGFRWYISPLGPGWSEIIYSEKTYLNGKVVKENLESSGEFEFVWIDYYGFDGQSISHQKLESTDEFVFMYGWGDCPSGCFGHHYWKIHVNDKCEVELVQEYGDDLPG